MAFSGNDGLQFTEEAPIFPGAMRLLQMVTAWSRSSLVALAIAAADSFRRRAAWRIDWRAAMIAAVLVAIVPATAMAHFQLKANIRIVHVLHRLDGLHVFLRLPTPLVIASFPETERDEEGNIVWAPYTVREGRDEETTFLFDLQSLDESPDGIASIVGIMHVFRIGGREVVPTVERFRIRSVEDVVKFSTPANARKALEGPTFPSNIGTLPVGDTVTDVELFVPWGDFVDDYAFIASIATGLPGEEQLETVLIDYYGGDTRQYRRTGTLIEPIVVTRAGDDVAAPEYSLVDAVTRFVPSGVRHILEGIDHVLFILCLVVGATGLASLIWRVTGFTLGHTVTLIAGFLGIAPSEVWFIPAIEAAIALSIIYAGVVAVIARPGAATFVITALIGLLHGFGFAFVLREVLHVDANWFWTSLLAFNAGIEIGQVAIVVVMWSLLLMIGRWSVKGARWARLGVAGVAISVAVFWVVERGLGLFRVV